MCPWELFAQRKCRNSSKLWSKMVILNSSRFTPRCNDQWSAWTELAWTLVGSMQECKSTSIHSPSIRRWVWSSTTSVICQPISGGIKSKILTSASLSLNQAQGSSSQDLISKSKWALQFTQVETSMSFSFVTSKTWNCHLVLRWWPMLMVSTSAMRPKKTRQRLWTPAAPVWNPPLKKQWVIFFRTWTSLIAPSTKLQVKSLSWRTCQESKQALILLSLILLH